jgi:hypothetical protein
MKPSRALPALILILILLIPTSLFADDASKPLTSMTAIFLKSDDVEDGKVQSDMLAAFASALKEIANVEALDFQSSLTPAAKSALKDDQMKRLLEFPELIAGTDHIRKNLRTQGLLVATVDMYGKSGKSYYITADLTFYDFRSGSSEQLDVGSVDFKGEMDKKDFFPAAAKQIVNELQHAIPGMQPSEALTEGDKAVVCNTQSRLFHDTNCHHLPTQTSANMTRAQALDAGYKPCPICYPEMRKRIKPDSTEALLGSEVAGFIEYYYRVSNDPEAHARLERIGRKILADNHFTKRDYVFTALNSDEINAFAAPAGYIYCTTGMLGAVESDDELAAVLGHEIAHVEQEHGVRQYRRAQKAATLGVLASIFTGQDLSFLSDFVRELVLRGYDRHYEAEADQYGYTYVQRTSFRPEAEFTLLGKLKDMELTSDTKIASWMRTHPKADERITSINHLKSEAEAASNYIKELDGIDPGLASVIRANEFKYVQSVDGLKDYVEAVKALP